MITSKLHLLVAVAAVGYISAVDAQQGQQHALTRPSSQPVSQSQSQFRCDLPPILDPAGDGLPSAHDLFSSDMALRRQIWRHQAVVRIPSVCYDDLGGVGEDERWAPFYELHNVLARTYPVVHQRSKVERVNTFGLLYTIQGMDPDLKPILLAAHQDVVPIADEKTWTHPPFSGHWDGEWLWGRGSADDKSSLTAILSSMEALLSHRRWRPTRTVILAFGFDEECTGERGAGAIADSLMRRYGRNGLAMVLDEGGLGMDRVEDVLYVLPAVYEKGYVDIWLELSIAGGHSSVPTSHTAIGIMSEMITALETRTYEPALIKDSPVHRHLLCQARYSPGAEPELTELLRRGDLDGVAQFLADAGPATRYMIQTSQAVDVIHGGQKINALPETVTLGVNYRVAHQDSIPLVQRNVLRHIREVVSKHGIRVRAFEGDEAFEAFAEHASSSSSALHKEPSPRVRSASAPTVSADSANYNGTLILQAKGRSDASPISPSSGPIWDLFAGTIRHSLAFGHGTTVVPVSAIMTGNTDTRYYLDLTRNIYRWRPIAKNSTRGVHTVNERIRMTDHLGMVRFYYELVRNFDASEVQ